MAQLQSETDRPHYVFAEDFVSVLVGPFQNRAEAEQHVKDHRHGDAHYEVISNVVANHIAPGSDVTPEQDIAWAAEMAAENGETS